MLNTPLSLYLHFPWCISKCPYCDFNSHKLKGDIPEQKYIETLLRDLSKEAERETRSNLYSIFMGGGTPSLFSASAIDDLFAGIKSKFNFDESEITLESNPGSFDQANFDGYREAGINRLSIGAQSFSSEALNRLGRIHNPDDIERAYAGARKAGFSRINIDLMHGLPGQSLEDAIYDLKKAIDLGPEHISWYQLTIEPNTRFYKYPPILPRDTILEDIFHTGNDLLENAGFIKYEVSAYSLDSEESLHNLNYWQFGDYLGVGAGAHGKITRNQKIIRTSKNKVPAEYIDNPVGKLREVDPRELTIEFLLNALRLTKGFSLSLFRNTTGLTTKSLEPFLEKAIMEGFLTRNLDEIKPTTKGQLFLNDLLLLVE